MNAGCEIVAPGARAAAQRGVSPLCRGLASHVPRRDVTVAWKAPHDYCGGRASMHEVVESFRGARTAEGCG